MIPFTAVNRIRLLTAIGAGLLYVGTNRGTVGLQVFHCFEFKLRSRLPLTRHYQTG
jgi:hypothetical protein